MKNILISGYYGSKNGGDEAILSSMLDVMREMDADLKFTVISLNPKYTKKRHNVDAVSWLDIFSIIRKIISADLLISGGGSLLQNVIKQEETDYGEDNVRIYRQMRHLQNVCAIGEDYKMGEILLEERTHIGAVETGIIASTGRTEAYVYRRPRALVLSTGDELSMPGDELRPGKIYDSNLFTIEALLTSWGVEVTEAVQVPDEPEKAAEVISKYADSVDMIVSTGGVSVGKKDIMHDVYALLGVSRTFWKIGIKPGAAMMSGNYKGKIVLSLSGNPYAAFVDLHLAVRPVVMTMNGNDHFGMVRSRATLMSDYDRPSPIRRFVRAFVQDGKAYIEGHLGGNGDIASGRGINALIEIPAGSDALKAGEEVRILFL